MRWGPEERSKSGSRLHLEREAGSGEGRRELLRGLRLRFLLLLGLRLLQVNIQSSHALKDVKNELPDKLNELHAARILIPAGTVPSAVAHQEKS